MSLTRPESRTWIRTAAAAAAVCLAAALIVAGTDSRLQEMEKTRGAAHHLLYLPNGKYLRLVSLGNAPLLADLIYLWSIQYYGNFQIADRYTYVDHVYTNVITDLDPRYFDPYWIGSLILSVESHDLEHALGLLDKGFAKNPDQWIFPYLAGWECASAKQYDRAIVYFRKVAAVPSAPPDIGRLVAGMYQREGNTATALAEWTRIGQQTKDPAIRKVAENRIRALTTDQSLAELRAAIDRYRTQYGRPPARLGDLVREKILARLPEAGSEAGISYDPATGAVASGSPHVLGP